MTVALRFRSQAGAAFGHRATGGPVTTLAQGLHARLYGLPEDPDPLPTALDALLQITHTAATGERHTAILHRLADQLRNAAEILQLYRHRANFDGLPGDAAERLQQAHHNAQQIVTALDHVAPAYTNPPPAQGSHPVPGQQHRQAPAPASPANAPTPLAGRRR